MNKREIQRELVEKGFVVSIDRWPTKLTYYRPDGEALPNLPADPWSMQRYTRRGFLTAPPENPVEIVEEIPMVEPTIVDLIPCTFPRCRYKGTARGLVIHSRKHTKEEEDGKFS